MIDGEWKFVEKEKLNFNKLQNEAAKNIMLRNMENMETFKWAWKTFWYLNILSHTHRIPEAGETSDVYK